MNQPNQPNPPSPVVPTIVTIPANNNSLSTAGLLLALAFAIGIGVFIGSQDSVRTKLPWAKAASAEAEMPSVPAMPPEPQGPVAYATPPATPGAWMRNKNVGSALDRGAYNKTQGAGRSSTQQ